MNVKCLNVMVLSESLKGNTLILTCHRTVGATCSIRTTAMILKTLWQSYKFDFKSKTSEMYLVAEMLLPKIEIMAK